MNENVPIISASGTPLMPCKPSKARKLLARNLAEKCWNRLGQFYLQLKFNPKSPNQGQHVCLAVDTGSKWDGMAVVTKKKVLTTAELVLPKGIAGKHGKIETIENECAGSDATEKRREGRKGSTIDAGPKDGLHHRRRPK
jgi:hypothetical protein